MNFSSRSADGQFVLLLLLLVGCSRQSPAVYGETPEYFEWKRAIGVAIPSAGFATKIDGSIDFNLGDRPCTKDDWIEVYYQHEYQRRTYIYSEPGTPPRILRYDFKVMTGPVWIDFFDTVTNRGYKFPMFDTRTVNGQAADFVFTPGGPDGFSCTQTGR